MKLLPREFYDRDPRTVAGGLLGKVLRRRSAGTLLSGRIVEVEAYLGQDDLAAHSAAGRTERNQVLFGPPGHAYVYFIYGMYHCLNVSCLPEGDAGCVLIRALEPLEGTEEMARLRGLEPQSLTTTTRRRLLTSGPGRLCSALGITREHDNGKDVTSRLSDLQIADDGSGHFEVGTSARIGITQAAELPLRYFVVGNPYVSVAPTRRTAKKRGI